MPAPGVPFDHLSRAELDHQLSPSRVAKDFLAVLARHEAQTASLDRDPGLHRIKDIAYGDLPRLRYDLTLPLRCASQPLTGGAMPCLMFVHGGFWQEGSKAGSGFAARACALQGWAHAAVGYTLAPEARLGDIVAEVGQALLALQREGVRYGIDPDRIVIAGHSAGGHLCAAVLAGMAGIEAAEAVRGAVLISGVYDLAPVAASYVNDVVRISQADVPALSPLLAQPQRNAPVHIVVGQQEPDAFQHQSLALRAAWSPWLSRLTFECPPGRDHFDVLDELTRPASPASPVWAALLEMVA